MAYTFTVIALKNQRISVFRRMPLLSGGGSNDVETTDLANPEAHSSAMLFMCALRAMLFARNGR